MSTLDDAVRQVAEELSPGQPVIGWVLAYATLPAGQDDGTTELTVIPAEGQPSFASAGLLTLAREQVSGPS